MNYIIGKNIEDFSFVTNAMMPEKMTLRTIIAHKIDNPKGETPMKLYFFKFNDELAEVECISKEVRETKKFYLTSDNSKLPYSYSKVSRVDKNMENEIIMRDGSYVMFTADSTKLGDFKAELVKKYKNKIDIFNNAILECGRIIDKLEGKNNE